MKKRRKNALLSQRQLGIIQVAIERLEALCDPQNTRCGVDPEAKKQVQTYVRSWIIPNLRHLHEHAIYQINLERWAGE